MNYRIMLVALLSLVLMLCACPFVSVAQRTSTIEVDHSGTGFDNIKIINEMGKRVTIFFVHKRSTFSRTLEDNDEVMANLYGGKRALCIFDDTQCIQTEIIEISASNSVIRLQPTNGRSGNNSNNYE